MHWSRVVEFEHEQSKTGRFGRECGYDSAECFWGQNNCGAKFLSEFCTRIARTDAATQGRFSCIRTASITPKRPMRLEHRARGDICSALNLPASFADTESMSPTKALAINATSQWHNRQISSFDNRSSSRHMVWRFEVRSKHISEAVRRL